MFTVARRTRRLVRGFQRRGRAKGRSGSSRDPLRFRNVIDHDLCESLADIFPQLVGVNLTLGPSEEINAGKKLP